MNSLNLFADSVLVLHFSYVLFVVAGWVFLFKWPKTAWIHIPAVGWAVLVECAGWICPLTPLENRFRIKGNGTGYQGDFLERYLMPVLYPEKLAREMQILIGIFVLVLNLSMYFYIFFKRTPK